VITGSVNAQLEAVLQLQIEDSSGHLHPLEVVIDTGFTGDLTLPGAQISAFGLPRVGDLVARLADGSLITVDVHDAILWWDGYPVQVRVRAVDTTPLVGTGLLAGHELKVRLVPGGAVTIERIP
jgi:predicted aspartyl protease